MRSRAIRAAPASYPLFEMPQLWAVRCLMLTPPTLRAKRQEQRRFWVAMVKRKDSETRPYHHGDLRRAIVTAALDILSETQNVDFSLRELARRAGVSHNAPYKHFAEKSELLAAVSAAGFELLTRRIADQTVRIDNPRAQLFVILRNYACFGVENPALYRLMFGGYLSGPDSSRPAIERAAADGALGQPIADAARNARKIAGAILTCWSLVHGLTLLMADGLVGPREKSDKLCESLVQGIIDGLEASVPSLPPGTWVGPRRDTAAAAG
jgi:AcrR family transcriptional regulator